MTSGANLGCQLDSQLKKVGEAIAPVKVTFLSSLQNCASKECSGEPSPRIRQVQASHSRESLQIHMA